MLENGKRRPAHPQIEILGAAEPTEAAAVVAAVEQFLADTAPASRPSRSVSPWQRAALLEGVSSKQQFGPDGTSGPDRRETWQ